MLDVVFDFLLYVFRRLIFRGILTGVGIIYIRLRYRKKYHRQVALQKLFENDYYYAGTAKTIQFVGLLWAGLILFGLVAVIFFAVLRH